MLYLLLLKGIIHESTLTAIISISCGAVDQILFTKRNELSCFLEVLSFQWSGSTKRPTGTTLAWKKLIKNTVSVKAKMCKRKQKRQRGAEGRGKQLQEQDEGGWRRMWNLPWFFTGVTYPLVLQSTVSGSVTPLGGRKWDPSRSVSLEKWERSPRKKKRYSSTVRSPNWFMARVYECPSELCCWIF